MGKPVPLAKKKAEIAKAEKKTQVEEFRRQQQIRGFMLANEEKEEDNEISPITYRRHRTHQVPIKTGPNLVTRYVRKSKPAETTTIKLESTGGNEPGIYRRIHYNYGLDSKKEGRVDRVYPAGDWDIYRKPDIYYEAQKGKKGRGMLRPYSLTGKSIPGSTKTYYERVWFGTGDVDYVLGDNTISSKPPTA